MSEGGLFSASICSDLGGIAANLCALALFLSPIPTFRKIVRNRSTEKYSGLPYIYTLLNCLICLWYGMPVISTGIILVATVNTIGAVFMLVYISIFIKFADKHKKVKMLTLLVAVFAVFVIIAFISLRILKPPNRQLFVGYLSVFSLIFMFASPLFIMNQVFKTKSSEYMPGHLSFAAFLMSTFFLVYGMCKIDAFIVVPNAIGFLLAFFQLLLYLCYSDDSEDGSTKPLLG